ncbi:hypothetical protein Taro_006785, partial [Colocasia esculenta]|nr:hypothetical protein [Colocasia esculenta]
MAWGRAMGRVGGEVAQIAVVDRMPALGKKRRFSRRTIPVDISPLKKMRCAMEEEDAAAAAAALPCVDVGEGGPEEEALLESCGGVDAYQILNKVGKGSYGVVFRARERETGDTVAVKKMKVDAAAIREISLLRSLPGHPCIVSLKEVVSDGRGGPTRDVYMVMEYMDSDLLGVIRGAKQPLSEGKAKYLMHQLLQGVYFLHANGVLHLDLKPSNLLLNREDELKVCDFGLSRRCIGGVEKQQPYTNLVVTLWYRAPELLLMAEGYSSAVDMWSVGCIMAELLGKPELLGRAPLFPGRNELDQLHQIFGVLGVPDEATWPGFASLCSDMNVDLACSGRQPYSNKLKEKLPWSSSFSEAGYDLLVRLLAYDPSRRLTAEEALNHPWFREEDAAAAAAALPCVDVGEGGPEEEALLESCGGVDAYQILNKVGKGSYGVVFRARERETGDTVAVKKMKVDAAAIREISLLRSLPGHPCIVSLKEVVSDGRGGPTRDVYMVMEYMDSDLLGVIRGAKQPLSEGKAKYLMHQLLQGVYFLHANGVLHLDLKPSNLLLNREDELKVCDFGLSRRCIGGVEKQQPYTNLVVTLWYRAPELLLMAEGYSSAVDMWSVGCIMAELLGRAPLFPGRNELDQLHQIFGVLGVPDEATWPGFASLCSDMNVDLACSGRQPYSNKLKEKLPWSSSFSEAGYDLLVRLLAYDPSRRLTAEETLNHPWFREVPAPTRPRL